MARLEELTAGARVRGLIPDHATTVVQVQWHGSDVLTLTHRDDAGRVAEQLLYRDDESRLEVEESGRAWSFDADGRLFRIVSEARRISFAYLFDPFLAVQISDLDPLPHQIEAVYERMLPQHPLRFLLADDPGAGKTIMAGLSGPRRGKGAARFVPHDGRRARLTGLFGD